MTPLAKRDARTWDLTRVVQLGIRPVERKTACMSSESVQSTSSTIRSRETKRERERERKKLKKKESTA